MKIRISHLLSGIGLVMLMAQPALAKPHRPHPVEHSAPFPATVWPDRVGSSWGAPTYYAGNEGRRISPAQAKSAAMRRVRGAKFVNVQLVGHDTYRVRLQQKNGRIIDVYVDAYTGEVKN